MQTHHLEYVEGGILDMDDDLSDLVEDRDKVRTEWLCFNWSPGSTGGDCFVIFCALHCFALSLSSAVGDM